MRRPELVVGFAVVAVLCVGCSKNLTIRLAWCLELCSHRLARPRVPTRSRHSFAQAPNHDANLR
jgi:hypothetical protein